jgi:hypothetical protein
MVSSLLNKFGYSRLLHYSRIRDCLYGSVTVLIKYASEFLAPISESDIYVNDPVSLVYRTSKPECREKQGK